MSDEHEATVRQVTGVDPLAHALVPADRLGLDRQVVPLAGGPLADPLAVVVGRREQFVARLTRAPSGDFFQERHGRRAVGDQLALHVGVMPIHHRLIIIAQQLHPGRVTLLPGKPAVAVCPVKRAGLLEGRVVAAWNEIASEIVR